MTAMTAMTAAAFTIVAKNYLAFARVLMSSLRKWAPEMKRIVVLTDKPDGYFDPDGEDFEVILSEDLPIPLSRWFHFKYTILELSTAVKPYAVQHILERTGVERLLYFDPDIEIYAGLDPVLAPLGHQNIALTPHLTAPLDDDRRPGDLEILRSGTYNLGFLGLRRSEETDRFVRWWQGRLYDRCVVDLAKGLFVDQRWIDLAPGLFDGVAILRDPGLNVAYWNLAHRRIEKAAEGYLVNGHRLRFFHFSGFDPDNPHRFSRHQDRFTLDDLGDARELALDYRNRLLQAGHADCKAWPYAYGAFSNGVPIADMGRPAHHEVPELLTKLSDPFSDEGYRAFLEVWNQRLAGPDGKPSGVTRLAYRIYRARSDVQAAMPDIFNGDLLRFLNWLLSSGRREHQLSDAFIEPILESVRNRKEASAARESAALKPADPIINERIIQSLAGSGIWVHESTPVEVGALNELIGNGSAKLHLSRLARAIYESRPDLQQFFPDPCGRDGIPFLTWLLTYGAREYRLANVFVAPLRTQWQTVVNSLPNPVRRVWCRALFAMMASSVEVRSRLGTLRGNVRLMRTVAGVKLRAARTRLAPAPAVGRDPDRAYGEPVAGVNLIGYLRSEMGVGESLRCAIRALRAAGIQVAVKSVDAPGPYRLGDRSFQENGSIPWRHNIFHVNADQAEAMVRRVGPAVTGNRRNIGYWAWELEEFPDKWLPAFRLFDEIWTPSTFCQSAIARKSPVPVIRIPHSIDVPDCPPADRQALDIPAGAFVFLAVFDLLSVFERKNPLGLLAAFREAFAGSPTRHLVLKINNSSQCPADLARLREALAGLPVSVVDRTIDREQVAALIGACDCLVSLHRSEGFGLVLAEAMYLGKPVIATGYSGNTDFTKPDNSFLVDYDLVPVPPGCEPYEEGCCWAEPRFDHAVSQLRLVAEDRWLREARALRGKTYVREHLSPLAVAKLMRERLGGPVQDRVR